MSELQLSFIHLESAIKQCFAVDKYEECLIKALIEQIKEDCLGSYPSNVNPCVVLEVRENPFIG